MNLSILHFGGCKLHLSSIMDLYNREIIAYTISDPQNTNFVLDTLNQLNLNNGIMLHSDQGSVYTSQAYYLTCIEWFLTSLKTETFYLHKMRKYNKNSITNIVKNDITFYNETGIHII